MITLALDTSTAVGSVALLDEDRPVAEATFQRGELFPAIRRVLGHRRPDLIAVGVGPGSFTGIRVGLAAAKGLALPTGIPVRAANSFDALAVTVAPQMPAAFDRLCVWSDARRGEIYHALYDRAGRPVAACRIGVVADLPDNAWRVSPESAPCRWAVAVGRLARTSDLKLEPLYLRPTQYRKL